MPPIAIAAITVIGTIASTAATIATASKGGAQTPPQPPGFGDPSVEEARRRALLSRAGRGRGSTILTQPTSQPFEVETSTLLGGT